MPFYLTKVIIIINKDFFSKRHQIDKVEKFQIKKYNISNIKNRKNVYIVTLQDYQKINSYSFGMIPIMSPNNKTVIGEVTNKPLFELQRKQFKTTMN